MIDTDKYEGHTPAPWEADLDDEGKRWIDAYDDEGDINLCRITNGNKADARLIADAPDLLAEVKRLREILGDIVAIDEWGGDGKEVGITITFTEGGSFSGWLNKDDEVIE